ncbi:NUDIX hydrolase domain-like protein [Lophiotrema nucula]|uniref:NUDIX hydrolase domain-like protein n=1 Tax=Lophiotrema nucula TaxID=690887 RepID=A0A6A5Z5B0_9PLEO|nr:NUDIX hydrolase domain-like protein [Lophiotrema nucula]
MACNGLHPRVAVIAIISDEEGRVIAGRRLSPLGTGQYSFPGGHLDQGEELFACAERETLEETGLNIRATKIVAVTNDVFVQENKHYVSIFVKGERLDPMQQPRRLEPHKCEGWEWKDWQDIGALAKAQSKQEVFLPVVNLVRDNPQLEVLLGCGQT